MTVKMPNGKEFEVHNNLIDGDITLKLSEILGLVSDIEDFYDLISTKLTGSPLLEEISIEELGEIKLNVCGKFQTILEQEEGLNNLDMFEEKSSISPK